MIFFTLPYWKETKVLVFLIVFNDIKKCFIDEQYLDKRKIIRITKTLHIL
jgi:hypothetical protein